METDRWQQIKRLYNSALERKAGERRAYLEQACQGDEALLQEVESLLAHDQPTEELLGRPAPQRVAEILANMQSNVGASSLVGRQLGSYQLLSQIGAGGMGEVYQARDLKLRRDVAIKVLPPGVLHDPERLARFQREARLLASLNHPNVATIHGMEESGGVHYLLMELVPGETLAERIRKGPLPVEEALKIAAQVAEGLEAAHEKGVIHRDLKPANVKVTPEGRVKLLDFGLAKAFADERGQDLSNAPTVTAMATEEGRILGTPAYMSPEQVRGKPVDKRTDIWAFGCLFYELLVARPAFRGETVSDTLAKVLEREPEWETLPAATPARLQELLHRCLEKDPRRRLRDIGDARTDLLNALGGSAGDETSQKKPFRMTRRAAIGTLAGAAAGAIGIGTSVWYFRPENAKAVMRLNIDVSPAQLAGFT